MDKLLLAGLLSKLGYRKFKPAACFFSNTLVAHSSAYKETEDGPLYYSISSESGERVYFWSYLDSCVRITKSFENPDYDIVSFQDDLYINSTGFIIKAPSENISSVFSLKNGGLFRRPLIVGKDKITGLGAKLFMLSNAGILYSTYEFVFHKVLNASFDSVVFDIPELDYPEKSLVAYRCQQDYISHLGDFECGVVHLVPKAKRNFFDK